MDNTYIMAAKVVCSLSHQLHVDKLDQNQVKSIKKNVDDLVH